MATIEILLKCHGTTLREFQIEKYSEYPPVPYTLPAPSLECLHMRSLAFDVDISWSTKFLVVHHGSLRHLQLGVESTLASIYTSGVMVWDTDMQPVSQRIYEGIEDAFSRFHGPQETHGFTFDTLSLSGLDLGVIFNAKNKYLPGLSDLTALVLESCSGVSQTFQDLLGPVALRVPPAGIKLRSFSLRAKCDPSQMQDFKADLEAFLCSFQGLRRLEVLLEGSQVPHDQSAILKAHGNSLETFIWDERSKCRAKIDHGASVIPGTGHLRAVSAACSNLTSLGLALQWKSFTSSSKYHSKVKIPEHDVLDPFFTNLE